MGAPKKGIITADHKRVVIEPFPNDRVIITIWVSNKRPQSYMVLDKDTYIAITREIEKVLEED